MNTINLLAIDLAKNVFQLHGNDAQGNIVLRKTIRRAALAEFVARLPACLVVMEACGGAHHWGRRFREFGHEVKLINPQFVKAFVKSNKNDRNDAEAIATAASQKSMRFVPLKEQWQQEIQVLHRTRELLMKTRISFSNSMRGLLAEFGIVLPLGQRCEAVVKAARLALDESHIGEVGKRALNSMMERVAALQEQLCELDKEIERLARSCEDCKRLQEIEGIGPITATAIVGSTQAGVFKNERSFAASLGLVPKQHSTGGRSVLLGISKKGLKGLCAFMWS